MQKLTKYGILPQKQTKQILSVCLSAEKIQWQPGCHVISKIWPVKLCIVFMTVFKTYLHLPSLNKSTTECILQCYHRPLSRLWVELLTKWGCARAIWSSHGWWNMSGAWDSLQQQLLIYNSNLNVIMHKLNVSLVITYAVCSSLYCNENLIGSMWNE